MGRKLLFAVSLGLVCGLIPVPCQVRAQSSPGSQHQSLPPDWVERVLQEQLPEKKIQLLSEYFPYYRLQSRGFPAQTLAPLLKDSHPLVRRMAFSLLNPYDANSLSLVISALDDPDEATLLQAIEFLVRIKGNDSAPYLFRFLEHGPANAEAAAVYVLGRYKHPDGLGRLVQGLTRYGIEVLTPALSETERRDDESDRFNAYFRALRNYPVEELLPMLRPALSASEPGVKLMAFRILYYAQVPEVEAPLLAWMRSAPDHLKPAIMGRVLIRNPEGEGLPFPTRNPEILAEILAWAFGKQSEHLQGISRRYLSRSVFSGNVTNYKLLEPYFQNHETRDQILEMLPYGFADGNPHLIPYLLQGLSSSNKQVVLQSVQSLARAESPEIDAKLAWLTQTHQDPEVLSAVFRSLSETPQNQALLKSFVKHPDANVRLAALDQLSRYRSQDARPDRETLLKRFREDTDQRVRLQALQGLCELKEETLLPSLLEQVMTRYPEQAHNYIQVLRSCRPHKPELLYPFLKLGVQAQQSVVGVLIGWRSGQAAAQVAPLLKSEDRLLQYQILDLIQLTKPDAAGLKQHILPLLRSSDPGIQEMALSAWNSLKGLDLAERRAAMPLEVLSSKNDVVRSQDLAMLTMEHGVAIDLQLFTRHILQENREAYYFTGLLDSLYYAQDPQTLLPLLDHTEQRMRESVVEWFAKHGDYPLLSELQHLMGSFSPDGQAAALQVMGAIASRDQADLIKKYLNHSDVQVRLAAVLALGLLRVPETGQLSTVVMEEVSPESQLTAIRALQALRTSEAVPGLVKALSSPLEDSRREAVIALRRINARTALPEIMQLFSQQALEDLQVGCFGFPQRELAVDFLSHLVDAESLPDFIRNIRPEDLFFGHRASVSNTLAELVLPHRLLPYLNDPRPLVRVAMADTLANYPDPQWIPSLQARLNIEEHPQVKLSLRLTLGQLGDQTVVEGLLEDYQKPEFNYQNESIAETLLQLKAPQFSKLLQQQALLKPENHRVWWHLSQHADDQTLDWLKQMTDSQDLLVRKNAASTLQGAQSLSNPPPTHPPAQRPLPTLDAKFESRLQQYLSKLELVKDQPVAMLRLAHLFLNASSDEDMNQVLWKYVLIQDPRLKPVLIPLLLESVERYNQVGSHRELAMSALRAVKLSPEDPFLLNLIQHLPLKDKFAVKLFQAQLWHEQGQTPKAIGHLTNLLNDTQLWHYPAYQVRALHWLSDFSSESDRLRYLNQVREIMAQSFTDRDFQHFKDLQGMLTALRLGSALLAAQEPQQAQVAYQQALGELYTHDDRRDTLLQTSFGALIHAGLAEAAMQQGQKDLSQAHLILALDFWTRNAGVRVLRDEYFTNYLPIRHSPKWAYDHLIQSLGSPDDSKRLAFFQDRFQAISDQSSVH